MAAIILNLAASHGDARMVAGLPPPASDGTIDISADDWSAVQAVIRGLRFERFRLHDNGIRPDFMECNFRESAFQSLTSMQHFWGGGNSWLNCTFSQIELVEPFSPQNRFIQSKFDYVILRGYEPYETIFSRCTFHNVKFEGFRAARIPRTPTLEELRDTTAVVLFDDCEFVDPEFKKCYFDRIEFRHCRFSRPRVQGCEFSDVLADEAWWPKDPTRPFVVFLDEVLALIERRAGRESKAYREWSSYRDEYRYGRTTDTDFAKRLYGQVPDEELDLFEDDLLGLSRRSAL